MEPAKHEDWILAKLIKNPDYLLECCEHLKPWHFVGEKKKLFELLTRGIETVPKRGKNYEEIRDANGELVLETRYTPTTVNSIESQYANSPYFAYLITLDEPSLKEMRYHVKGMLGALKTEKMMAIYKNAIDQLEAGTPLGEVEGELSQLKMELERSHSNESLVATSKDSYKKLIDQTVDKIDSDHAKVSSGFQVLDYLLNGGFAPGDFAVFASKSGQGKSMLTTQSILSMAVNGLKVGVLSLEMDEVENVKRIWCHLSKRFDGFTSGFYQSNFERRFETVYKDTEKWKDFNQVEGKYLSELPIYYIKPKDINVEEMKKYFNLLYDRYNCDVILLDHMLLVTDNKEERLIVKDIANFMKIFAAEKKIICIGVSQMNRGSKVEKLDDLNVIDELSGGRSIEQAATQVITISRVADKANAANPYLNAADMSHIRKISLIKSRHSKDGTHFFCDFMGDASTFAEILPDNWEDVKNSDVYSSRKLEYSEFQ